MPHIRPALVVVALLAATPLAPAAGAPQDDGAQGEAPSVEVLRDMALRLGSPADAVADPRSTTDACLTSRVTDTRDVARMDIDWYDLIYRCNAREWRVHVSTFDGVSSNSLYVFATGIDRDQRAATGCEGADSLVVASSDNGTYFGAVFHTPSCDESRWVVTGPVSVTQLGLDELVVAFPGSAIAHDQEFRHAVIVEDNYSPGYDVDRAPDAGWRVMRVPCGIGSTAFAKTTARQVYGAYDDMVGGDFNGDDIDDLFFYGAGSAPDGLLRGHPSGLQAVTYRPPVNGLYDGIVAGDFNGDGADDIFFYGRGSRQDGYLLAQNGTFNLTPVSNSVQVTRGYDGLVAGDFNGDGLDDIFFYGASSAPDGLLRGTVNGLRATSGSVQVSRSYDSLAAGDVNNDGYDDIVFYGRGSAPEGLLLGSPTWLKPATPGTANGVYHSMLAGDFNGNGFTDLFFYAPGTPCEGLLRGTPSGLQGVRTPGVDGVYDAYAAGDFDGDGRDDIFFYGRGSAPEGQLLGR